MRLSGVSLSVLVIFSLLVGACTDSVEPTQDPAEGGLSGFEGQIDPGSESFVLKNVAIESENEIPVLVELVGRFVRTPVPVDGIALAVGIRNIDQRALFPPAELVLRGFVPPPVFPSPDNPDWIACPGDPGGSESPAGSSDDCLYGYDYSDLLGDDAVLSPLETSGEKLMVFIDPGYVSFSFNVDAHFGLTPQLPVIAGTFFSDLNENGRFDPEEPPFGGGSVRVNGPGVDNRFVPVDSDGRFVVRVREAGLYNLWGFPPPTFAPVEPTTSNPLEVVLLVGADGQVQSFLHADFGWVNALGIPPVQFVESEDSLILDQYALLRIEKNDRVLGMRVGFSGCSEDHPFGLFMVGSFMESNPVQARLLLSHDDRGELCDAYWERELAFDLSGILRMYERVYGEPGVVILNFVDWSGETHKFELQP